MAAQMTLMQRARTKLLLKHPFFAAVIMSTEMKEDKGCKTAYTDMKIIGYNPDFINSLELEVVIFVILHEVMHIILMHGLRRGNRELRRWNIACDFAINIQLEDWKFELWEHCCIDPKYRGMSAEQIYDLLPKQEEDGGGDEQGGLDGDLQEPEDMSREGKDKVQREIERIVINAANVAKMAGKMPANLDILLGNLINPEVPWPELLREFLTRLVGSDETWSRRNKRVRNIYLPAKQSNHLGEIVVIPDASGSMFAKFSEGVNHLEKIASEINGVVEQMRPERIRVVWADDSDDVGLEKNMEIFEDGDPLTFHAKGGGGTDMRKPLGFVQKFDPIVVILMTDGYTPWPTTEPDYPLIVLCTTDAPCPIGQVVRVKEG